MKTVPTSLFGEESSSEESPRIRSNPRMCPRCDSEELENGECWECGYKEGPRETTTSSTKLEVKDVHKDTFSDSRIMTLRYSGYCVFCGRSIKAGKRAYYFPELFGKSGSIIRKKVISCLDHEREYRVANAKFDFVVGDKVQYDDRIVTILEVDKTLGTYKVLLPDGSGMILQTGQVKKIEPSSKIEEPIVESPKKVISDNSSINEIISTMKDESSIDLALGIIDKRIEEIGIVEKLDYRTPQQFADDEHKKYVASHPDEFKAEPSIVDVLKVAEQQAALERSSKPYTSVQEGGSPFPPTSFTLATTCFNFY